MARIYYNEEKLAGDKIRSSIITPESFDYIINNTNKFTFNITPETKNVLWILKKEIPAFRFAQIRKDAIFYNASEGNFYLPNGILFFDNDDYNFPSEFYFLAQIKGEIELRKCIGGKDVQWFQIPALHTSVNDVKIIHKIENTFLQIENLVKTEFNVELDNIRRKELEEKTLLREKNRMPLSDKHKHAYLELVNICMSRNKNKDEVIKFISSLKSYDGDEEYYTTLNRVMGFLDENEIHFIMSLDWKAAVEDLNWRLSSALKDNFTISVPLPQQEDYGEQASISHEGVLRDFEERLRTVAFQISLIDTESDEYVVLVHPIADKNRVEEAINAIGYNCHQINHLDF